MDLIHPPGTSSGEVNKYYEVRQLPFPGELSEVGCTAEVLTWRMISGHRSAMEKRAAPALRPKGREADFKKGQWCRKADMIPLSVCKKKKKNDLQLVKSLSFYLEQNNILQFKQFWMF